MDGSHPWNAIIRICVCSTGKASKDEDGRRPTTGRARGPEPHLSLPAYCIASHRIVLSVIKSSRCPAIYLYAWRESTGGARRVSEGRQKGQRAETWGGLVVVFCFFVSAVSLTILTSWLLWLAMALSQAAKASP